MNIIFLHNKIIIIMPDWFQFYTFGYSVLSVRVIHIAICFSHNITHIFIKCHMVTFGFPQGSVSGPQGFQSTLILYLSFHWLGHDSVYSVHTVQCQYVHFISVILVCPNLHLIDINNNYFNHVWSSGFTRNLHCVNRMLMHIMV